MASCLFILYMLLVMLFLCEERGGNDKNVTSSGSVKIKGKLKAKDARVC